MQKIINLNIITPLFAVMLTLSLFACASTGTIKRAEMDKLLRASGFKMRVADTAGKLTQLKKLPQGKIFPHEEGGKIVYIYADAKNCNCAYAGDEEAFKKYQKLIQAKQVADEDRRDAIRQRQQQQESNDRSFGRDW
jgi:hypothetical protein